MNLGEFLRGVGPGPWNCSTIAADWCLAQGHPDFAADWRGITDPDECDEITAHGLVPLWDRGIGDALPVVEAPFEPGDIGVIRAHGLEAGAIFTGERWALRSPRGFAAIRLGDEHVLKAWRPTGGQA